MIDPYTYTPELRHRLAEWVASEADEDHVTTIAQMVAPAYLFNDPSPESASATPEE
jgi:hypothetical protein